MGKGAPHPGPRGGHGGMPGSAPVAPVPAGHGSDIDQIKQGQRFDPAFKEAWNTFCDTYCDGIRDPGRHPAVNLTLFLAQQGPPRNGSAPGLPQGPAKGLAPVAPGAKGKGKGKGPGVAAGPEVMALAEQVKALQRSDPATKAAWVQYCDTPPNDGTKDPARHGVESLQAFLDQYGGGGYGAWQTSGARPRQGPY